MRAVDNGLDAASARHLADGFHRRDLASDIDLMRDLNQSSARSNRFFEGAGYLVDVFWRDWNFDQVQLDAFALFALPHSREHASVILCGRENLVSRFQIQTEQQSLQRLGSVARDSNLFRIASKQFRQPGAN